MEEVDVMFGYEAGLRSASDVVNAARRYRGDQSHFLWDKVLTTTTNQRDWRGRARLQFLLYALSEEKMYELVRSFVEDDPNFPLKRHPVFGCFLHEAILSCPLRPNVRDRPFDAEGPPRRFNVSTRVMLLLAVPGVTRVKAGTHPESRTFLPLYACLDRDVDMDVIDRLIELDPDVIALSGSQTTWNPLHHILAMHNPVNLPLLSRMAQAKPEALLCREVYDRTVVHMALEEVPPAMPELASLLEMLVRRVPGTAHHALSTSQTALFAACTNFHTYPNLLCAVIADYPMALCLHCDGHLFRGGNGGLPYDAASERQSPHLALLEKHTLHMALAVIELALAGALSPSSSSSWTTLSSSYLFVEGERPETFRQHVRDTVDDFLAATPLSSAALDRPFATAESVRNLENRMECCRALFQTRMARMLLLLVSQPGNELGRTVVDLYGMNCRGRSNPSAAHQVRLLASVRDNLDCIYLHFREFWVHILPQNEAATRGRKRRYDE